ncbi:hypothetical protein XO12_03750 [Marinitoga sp. 1154]|uniref:hypothetical protein n=1 Tax=Marinitoga sp. 1154 TaxID=1643335 RepID=UPI001586DEC7|nr:hypothetical protein [Marinitoga sp. 1154]NUU99252.1 hypothetical protein [Marinitoga sp. 1154]
MSKFVFCKFNFQHKIFITNLDESLQKVHNYIYNLFKRGGLYKVEELSRSKNGKSIYLKIEKHIDESFFKGRLYIFLNQKIEEIKDGNSIKREILNEVKDDEMIFFLI